MCIAMGVTTYIECSDKDTWLLRNTFKILFVGRLFFLDGNFRSVKHVVCEYSIEIIAWNL